MSDACPYRLARVQSALRRRAADLRDSLVLSEFLQNLQEEESRNRQGPAAVSSEDGPAQGLVCDRQGDPRGPLSGLAAYRVTPHFAHTQCLLASAREQASWLAEGFSPALGPG